MAVPFDWDSISCAVCRIRVAFMEDAVASVWPGGVLTRVFNVNNVNPHQSRIGGTVADTYCAQCGMMLGWKLIEITQQHLLYRAGRFLLRLDRLSYSLDDDQDLEEGGDSNDENAGQDVGVNGQNADQYGVANEQVPNEQDLGANEQNADQDLGANEQVPKEQEVGVNEQNVDQDGGNNQQVPNEQNLGANEQNADQVGGNNQQVPNEQDLGANEQNADQDGGGNEQNDDDEDGGQPTKRRKME